MTEAGIDSALVLVAHGSPDPDWRKPLLALRERLAAQRGADRVGLAYLAHPPTIGEVAAELADLGHAKIVVVAALLSPGGRHVKRDLPAAVDELRRRMPELSISLVPGALGDDDGVIEALARAAAGALERETT